MGFADLKDLAAKQAKWRELSAVTKLGYINRILDSIQNSVGHQGFLDMANKDLDMMGMPSTTPEGQAQAAEFAFFTVMCVKQTLFSLKQAYELRAGKSKVQGQLTNLFTRKAINGQVVAQLVPGDQASKINPFVKNNTGEIWFDPMAVKEASDVKPFDFESFDKKSDKIMVVLGAGNWDLLAVNDCLTGLFVFNQCVFLKHHPLRGGSLEPLVRKMFAPLIKEGYFDSEIDMGSGRSNQIVYSPFVSTVHLTGGKATHDAIVWGHDKEEQFRRKLTNDPKLKAEISAELGAVTPWLVPPVEYTDEELDHLALSLASAVFNNSSCNCNAPKVLVMSKHWKQGPKLKELVAEHFSRFETPCSYYPGSKERWEATKAKMNGAKVVESKKPYTDQERQLSAPMFAEHGPVTLPLLTMDVDVDMSTAEGRQNAMDQHAFRQEPFAPTFCFACILDNGSVGDFLEKGVAFANDCLFGTLSCSMTVPPSLERVDAIEQAIANLSYGQVVLNAWSAVGFVMGMPWGGYPPKESNLAAVETGRGKVFNWYFLPHIEKAVIRTPIIADNHIIKPAEFPDPQVNIEALKFFVAASVDPADVSVGLSAKQVQMVSKLEHQVSYHEAHGDKEAMEKILDKISSIWEQAREAATSKK